jgi:hypothetical protein
VGLSFYESLDSDRNRQGRDKQDCDVEVDRLVVLLNMHNSPPNEDFVEQTVTELNDIGWSPQGYREALALRLAGIVPDAATWLAHHSAAQQALSLASVAPMSSTPQRRSRL